EADDAVTVALSGPRDTVPVVDSAGPDDAGAGPGSGPNDTVAVACPCAGHADAVRSPADAANAGAGARSLPPKALAAVRVRDDRAGGGGVRLSREHGASWRRFGGGRVGDRLRSEEAGRAARSRQQFAPRAGCASVRARFFRHEDPPFPWVD